MENFVHKVYIYSFCLLINFVTSCDKYSGKNIELKNSVRFYYETLSPFPQTDYVTDKNYREMKRVQF